ncbi:hypothetical protein L0337_24135 [candidate division KSB1 bacterium]|nr:hypothetical protein [candidate division KSB1 bacterium]
MLERQTESSRLRTQRLHIKLEDMDLQGLVDELTTATWKAIYRGEPDHSFANYQNLREALESVLSRHIVAFDLCGLATVCQEATEIDPC